MYFQIFNCSKIDVNLALTFLCSRPRSEVLEIMMKLTKASGHQYKRLKYVAVMGIALGQLLKEPKLIDNCQVLETDATWGYRLSKMKVRTEEYCKVPKFSDTRKLCCNQIEIQIIWPNHRVMCPKNGNDMTNSADPDQTAPVGAV